MCEIEVIECDNDIYLDYPSVPYSKYDAQWTIMHLGSSLLASVGNPSPDGTGHTLHDHQPEGSVTA